MLNNTKIYYLTLIVGIVQLISVIIYIISHAAVLGEVKILVPMINVSVSVVLCAAGFFISRYIRKNEELYDSHRVAVKSFFIVFIVLLILWGMVASIPPFLDGKQILTFYTVELVVVLLIRLRPVVTASVIFGSYAVFFAVLEIIRPGQLNVYNYFMLAALSVVGEIINYHLTYNFIEQELKKDFLNESLEIIANHDSMTRLKNRYALNQTIPEYLDTDICLAMGDINSFKKINDEFGHRTGDDILKTFSDIMHKYFDHEEIYRYGGDEFLIVSHGSDLEGFREKLDKLNEEFNRTDVDGSDRSFSCSFGSVSGHPICQGDFFDLILSADNKLYEKKKGSAK